MKKIFLWVISLSIAAMVWGLFSAEGIDDLEGGFRQLAFERNENNTGPVKRVYAVTVQDTLWEEMETYGDYMPYTKYGKTTVYFFLEGSPVPQNISLGTPAFDATFEPYCLAKYEKDAGGVPTLTHFPFR